MISAAIGYLLIVIAFVGVAISFGLAAVLGKHFASGLLSFALLLIPYWFFGFGAAEPLGRRLDRPWKRLAASELLLVPYLVFVVPLGAFQLGTGLGLFCMILAITAVLEHGRAHDAPNWHDAAALCLLAAAVELPWFRDAFPAAGLSGLSKLLFVDAGLFGFLVVRPIGGIGFDLRIRRCDVVVGFREFLFFLPIALTLGFVLHFLHFHPVGFVPLRFTAAWIFTFFFVALPEEIFFRGLLLNLLGRRWGSSRALIVTSLLFGLAHFPKRAAFNWRYVILAAIAGVFYGRAWLARRRVLTSGVTHATVDAVWSIWLR